MSTPNLQTTFDTIARHLLTQGHQAVNDGGDCVYRAPNGDRCAVGALIPDDLYTPSIEGSSADDMLHRPTIPDDLREGLQSIIGDRESDHVKLLVDLQRIHDAGRHINWPLFGIPKEVGSKLVNPITHEFDIPALKQALTVVASRFGLTTEVLNR